MIYGAEPVLCRIELRLDSCGVRTTQPADLYLLKYFFDEQAVNADEVGNYAEREADERRYKQCGADDELLQVGVVSKDGKGN